MSLPHTIKHPEAFAHSPSAGNDGVFDWSWTEGCFGEGKITPMDFDGVVERKGNFILFETKNVGVPIPKGQLYTLQSAHKLGCFAIFLIYGKTSPESCEIWYPGSKATETVEGVDQIRAKVSAWYAYADKNPRSEIDVSFLNKRIQSLDADNRHMAEKLNAVLSLAEQMLCVLRA